MPISYWKGHDLLRCAAFKTINQRPPSVHQFTLRSRVEVEGSFVANANWMDMADFATGRTGVVSSGGWWFHGPELT